MRTFPVLVFTLFLAAPAAADERTTPSGDGPLDEMVCRAPQRLPGERLLGPRTCLTNAAWAGYHKKGMDLSPDGIHEIPSEKYRTTHQTACRPATAGGSSVGTMMQVNIGTICE
jgi:hypothetical protein